MIKGKIKFISEVEKGTSKTGKDWQKVQFVIENNEGYEGREQIFAFGIFGEEKVSKFLQYNKVGKEVEVDYNIQCSEYKGKYYTNLDAWSIKSVGDSKDYSNPPKDEEDGDLPF